MSVEQARLRGGMEGLRLGWHRVRWPRLVLLLSLWLVAVNALALWLFAGRPYTIDAGGYGDQLLLRGFAEQERNDAGATYRWSGRRSEIAWSGVGLTAQLQATLLVGGTPPGAPTPLPTALEVNGQQWGTLAVASGPRRYYLLLPAANDGGLRLVLDSPLLRDPAENREIGLRLDGVELRLGPGPLLPPAWHLLAQLACLLLLATTLRVLYASPASTRTTGQQAANDMRRPAWPLLLGTCLLGGLLLAIAEAAVLPLMSAYLPRLVGAAAVLTLLTALGLPLARRTLPFVAERDLRCFWAVALVACGIRMAGMLYPPFATHDLPLNLKRLDAVTRGLLVLIAPSTEFAGEMTIYPPAPYIALLPSYLLLGSRPLVLQYGIPLLDGSSALFVGLLALRLGAASRAARIAAVLYAVSSLSFTALWWGFTAQAFGQWCIAPLALALIAAADHARLRTWIAAALLFQLALLSHIGVAVLAVVWVTLALGLLLYQRSRAALVLPPSFTRRALVFYVASGVMALVLLYADVFFFMIREAGDAGETIGQELGRGATFLFLKGTLLAYTPLGLPLVLVGLGMLWRRAPLGPRAVATAWVVTVLLFVAIDLLFGLIVRHLYFMLPLACIAAALPLHWLARRARWAEALAWGLVAAYGASGLWLWWLATIEYLKPTMAPLTH